MSFKPLFTEEDLFEVDMAITVAEVMHDEESADRITQVNDNIVNLVSNTNLLKPSVSEKKLNWFERNCHLIGFGKSYKHKLAYNRLLKSMVRLSRLNIELGDEVIQKANDLNKKLLSNDLSYEEMIYADGFLNAAVSFYKSNNRHEINQN